MYRYILFVCAMLSANTAAAAQLQTQAPPVSHSGSLVSFTDDSITLQDKDGKQITVAMSARWNATVTRPLTSAAIQPGHFIASANVVVDERTGKSNELRIHEAGYKPEEGTHLMQQATTAMTHGTVSAATQTAAGVELEVVYPGGSRRLIVGPEIRITGYEIRPRSELKTGMAVSVVTRKGADGVFRSGRLVMTAP